MPGVASASGVLGTVKYSCKYPSCKNSYFVNLPEGFKNRSFDKFPTDSKTLEAWKNACKLGPTVNCTNFHVGM